MAPVVRISETTYEKLKLLAEPFVDSIDAVIGRCVDESLAARGIRESMGNGEARAGKPDARDLEPESPGELKHTRVKRVLVDNQDLSRPNWNTLLRHLHVLALNELGFPELVRATGSNVQEGRREEAGFHYIPEADLSIQGEDSNDSWENSLRLAQHLGISLSVEFEWRNKEGAQHPGETGRIRWSP